MPTLVELKIFFFVFICIIMLIKGLGRRRQMWAKLREQAFGQGESKPQERNAKEVFFGKLPKENGRATSKHRESYCVLVRGRSHKQRVSL